MKRLHLIAVLVVLVAVPLLAGPRGIYFGGSVGQSFVKTEVTDIQDVDLKLDENDFAFKFLAGVRMSDMLAFEGGYKHLGNVRSKQDEYTFESETSGYDLCAVGNLYFGIADIFIKAGGFWWDQTIKFNEILTTDGSVDFMWGFGATVRLGTLGIRAEWERFELQKFDRLSMLSLGIVYGL